MNENENRNIYRDARRSAGLTQEAAAARIGVSVRCLADYEGDQRVPAGDVVIRMVDVYDARYLAYQHLRRTSELAARIVPEVGSVSLQEAVLTLVPSIRRFLLDDLDEVLMRLAADGKIDSDERTEFERVLSRLEGIVQSALAVVYGGDACNE